MSTSVKMTILVPKDWHKQLKVEAAMREMTITDIVKISIDEWLIRNSINDDQGENTQLEGIEVKTPKKK